MAVPPYVTQADLEKRFTAQRVAQVFSIQSPDGSNTGVVDADTLAVTIADASAEFEEIAATVFPQPFVQVGSVWDHTIIEIVAIFTMYRGTELLRPEYSDGKKLSPYEKAYKYAVKRAEEIKEGKRRFAGINGITTSVPANTGGQITNQNPTTVAPFHYFWPSPDGSSNSGSNGNGF